MNVTKLFDGLTISQARTLRKRIVETLPELRREVIEAAKAQTPEQEQDQAREDFHAWVKNAT